MYFLPYYAIEYFIMSQKVPMTLIGKKMLDLELKKLMSVDRPEVIHAIEVARGHGDLSENADYSAAKERQGFVEGRIQEINGKLINAEVINPSQIQSETVVFGATITLEEADSGNEVTYQIVGVDEADIKQNKVGITSPMARALIGKQEGDEIIVNAPKGKIAYTISKLDYL